MQQEIKKHILITSSNFPSGSASANFLNLFCKGLSELDMDTEVILIKGFWSRGSKVNHQKTNVTSYGTKYTYLGLRNRPSWLAFKLFDDLIRFFKLFSLLTSFISIRKDIVIYTYNNEFPFSLLINGFCKVSKIRVITFVPEYYDKSVFSENIFRKLKWYGFLLYFHYVNKLSAKLIVFSKYLRDRYVADGYPTDKILIQPNLTDFGYWEDKSASLQFTIGYSGTPSKKDGLEDLLRAISIVNKRGVPINSVIIGDVFSGASVIPGFRKLCKDLDIDGTVDFTGLVSLAEVREWMNKCMILAVTRPVIIQTMAGFPTKLGEYFACKKVVLATRVGDVIDYFTDRSDIVFAEPSNPESIADCIDWIIKNDDRCKEIALRGNEKARRLLSYKVIVPRIMEFILK